MMRTAIALILLTLAVVVLAMSKARLTVQAQNRPEHAEYYRQQ